MADKTGKKSRSISSIYETFLGSESALRRYLARFVYRQEDIDDMAQETFLRAYKAMGTRDLDHPKAYLFRVAKTVALRELNKKTAQMNELLDDVHLEMLQEQATLEQEMEADQKLKHYCRAIAELPPQCRRVFLMRKYQGLSHKEIARQLQITVGAVEKQVTLGIKRSVISLKKLDAGEADAPAALKQKDSHHE